MSVRDVFKWGGVSGTEKELVRATKLNAISANFGRSRCLGFTTPNYAFDSPGDGHLHIYRLLSPYIRVTLQVDASAFGSTTVTVRDYSAGGPTGTTHDTLTFTWGASGNHVLTKESVALPTDQELCISINDAANMVIDCAIVWEMPEFGGGLGSKLPLDGLKGT